MELLSPEYEKYKKILKENPKSKAFAFLANIYRKYDMMDEAMDILQKGIRWNPDYAPGHVILAQCHYDQGQYEKCYSILKPLINFNRDNFKMQSLFSRVCEKLELWEEALEGYRQLLYLDSKNIRWSEQIDFLEKKLFPDFEDTAIARRQNLFHEEKLSNFPHDVDEWVELSFSDGEKKEQDRIDANGPNNLMDVYDKKFGPVASREDGAKVVTERLRNFYSAINRRAASFLTR